MCKSPPKLCVLPNFYPKLPIFLHGYIRHIRDILQLCSLILCKSWQFGEKIGSVTLSCICMLGSKQHKFPATIRHLVVPINRIILQQRWYEMVRGEECVNGLPVTIDPPPHPRPICVKVHTHYSGVQVLYYKSLLLVLSKYKYKSRNCVNLAAFTQV